MTAHTVMAAVLIVPFLSAAAFGQALRDPTQPPAAAAPAVPAGTSSTGAGGPVLQSILVSEGRRLAVIDGKTYQTGEKLGNATVAAIAGNEVTLRGPEGTKVLKLYRDPQTSGIRERSAEGASRARR